MPWGITWKILMAISIYLSIYLSLYHLFLPYLQYWHLFRLTRMMLHCWFLRHGRYWIFCWILRRKNPCKKYAHLLAWWIQFDINFQIFRYYFFLHAIEFNYYFQYQSRLYVHYKCSMFSPCILRRHVLRNGIRMLCLRIPGTALCHRQILEQAKHNHHKYS